jgi:hypothetical protein
MTNNSTAKLATSQDLCQSGGFFMGKEYWSDIRNVIKWVKQISSNQVLVTDKLTSSNSWVSQPIGREKLAKTKDS